WGFNSTGRLGLGDTTNRGDNRDMPGHQMGDKLPPVNLGMDKKATALAAGMHHTCAVRSDGSIKCWGENNYGQLGLGDNTPRGSMPDQMGAQLPLVNLGTGKTVTALSAGYEHTCALLNDGKVKCWGENDHGQLGLGDNKNRGDMPSQMGN